MGSLPISQLTSSPAEAGDLLPVARSGANYGCTAASIANSGALKTLTTQISAAEILALDTTPISVLPAVAGMSHRVLTASLSYIPGSKGFVDPGVAIDGGNQFTLTSVANAIPQTFSLTGVAQTYIASLQGQELLTGSFSGGDPSYGFYGYLFIVTGLGIPANNGGPFLCGQVGPASTQLSVFNWGAQSETHAGSAVTGTTVYTGTIGSAGDDNALANQWVWINGFNGANNNGQFWCTASTSTSLTVANPFGTSETTSALATCPNAGPGQIFALNIPFLNPSPSDAISSYQVEFTSPGGDAVTSICGTLTPLVVSTGIVNPYLTPPGQPVLFVLLSEGGAPVAALTEGDGVFEVAVTYTEVGV